MGRRASPNGLQTWLWILGGLFVLCTLPLMAIALVQGTQIGRASCRERV